VKVDRRDIEILRILKQNSRTPIREIALKTKIKQSTVHQRISRLISKGIIDKFTIKTRDDLVGENLIMFVYLSAENMKIKELKSLKAVKEMHEITGEYNFLIKVKVKDIAAYNQLLKNIKKTALISKMFSTIVTNKIKEE